MIVFCIRSPRVLCPPRGLVLFSTDRTKNLFGKERASVQVMAAANLDHRPSRSLNQLVNSLTKAEQTVKKSRFIAFAGYANSREDARKFVDSVKNSKATHNCWAFVSKTCEMCSDDSELTNTAGPPILNAIKVIRLCKGRWTKPNSEPLNLILYKLQLVALY